MAGGGGGEGPEQWHTDGQVGRYRRGRIGAEVAAPGQGSSSRAAEKPQGGERVIGPLRPCLVFMSCGSWQSWAVSLSRPVRHAGTGRAGSTGALWGPLLGTQEAERVGRARPREQRLQEQ